MSRTGEIFLGSAVTALGLALLFVILPHEIRVVASEANEVSPAFFPRIVSGLIAVIGAAHVLVVALGPGDAADAAKQTISAQSALRAIATMVIGGAYIVLLPGIGFIAATAATLVALIALFGNRAIWQACAVAVPVAALLFYVFGELLMTPLPRAGWLE
jgi:hypothetical protein